jgi:hypothetical protein
MATDRISSPLDRLVDENNKKNLKISRNIKKMYILMLYTSYQQFKTDNKYEHFKHYTYFIEILDSNKLVGPRTRKLSVLTLRQNRWI